MSNSGLLVSLFLVSVASACFSATQPATRAYAVYAGVKQLVKREAKREIQIYKQSLPSKVFALYLNVWQGAELRTAVGRLKVQIVKHQLALSNISAQDEFARWAKTRRVLDKLKSEWETKGK